jgi:alkylated DNA repair dioxygenase AlkB
LVDFAFGFVCMHSNLFNDNLPKLPDAELDLVEGFYAFAKANELYTQLHQNIPWRADKIKVFGKVYDQPRLTQLYGDEGIEYGYSNINMQALPWTKTLKSIKTDIENHTGNKFNVCLVNLYRDGQDSNGWHADDEPELGQNPVIASISLGGERYFHLRHNEIKAARTKLLLPHGSLLVMGGATQHFYKHQIAKTKRQVHPRINLTFRQIMG